MPPSDKADATTWDGLSRIAFATDWDPDRAIDWSSPVDVGPMRDGWVAILHTFYAGEWQGLEIIERLMNRAAHHFAEPAMVTYYATQCYDEAKHLYVFRRYLGALSAPPAPQRSVDLLVELATKGPLQVERWILATWFTETLAASVFQASLELDGVDRAGREMIRLMLKDEARHIAGTKLGVMTVLDHASRPTIALLRAWWAAFARLAAREVKRLSPYGTQIGIQTDDVLRQTLARMEVLPRFAAEFLGPSVRRAFLG